MDAATAWDVPQGADIMSKNTNTNTARTDAARRAPMSVDVTVTSGNGNDLLDVIGAGAPGAFMLECAAAFAPRAKASKAANVSPGMRRFLNAGIRSDEGVSRLTVRDAKGRELVDIAAVRRV